MSIQKLHYENLGGMLIRREGLLSWRCPLCKAEGRSPEIMHTCPECGSKETTLPGAQPAPSIHEVTDAMALAFHAALTDGSIGEHEMEEIKAGLRAALAAAPEAKP